MSVVTGRPVSCFHLGQHFQPGLQPRAAKGRAAGAIGLVERGLEDQLHRQAGRDLLQLAGDRQRQLFASRSRTARRSAARAAPVPQRYGPICRRVVGCELSWSTAIARSVYWYVRPFRSAHRTVSTSAAPDARSPLAARRRDRRRVDSGPVVSDSIRKPAGLHVDEILHLLVLAENHAAQVHADRATASLPERTHIEQAVAARGLRRELQPASIAGQVHDKDPAGGDLFGQLLRPLGAFSCSAAYAHRRSSG